MEEFFGKTSHVDKYSGHRANQRPRSFTVDEQLYGIEAVLDQWYEPSDTYFKVQTDEGKVYLVRYDTGDKWTLQSGFDGDELFARPSIEFITVGPEVIQRAEELTESCEHCHPGDAEIPFDWLLAKVIGKHGPFEFILAEPARCANCKHEITEKTLTDPRQDASLCWLCQPAKLGCS
jgi:hypothetical protein